MGLLKNLFQKKEAAAKPVVQAYEPVSAKPAASQSAEGTSEKPRHGEDGVCCGSCQ